ncbi:MAG TPA: Rrf2 family transcriptional regulator [bacterium]|nr:Rrf2 family transcriptional regulator [bacterium]
MIVSKKSRYAMRAVFELAKQHGQGPIKISEIAKNQAIPARFLEVILCQLKQAGYVESTRGREGGYKLSHDPSELSVGTILRYFQGLQEPVDCIGDNPKERCPLRSNCVFVPMWEDMQKAISGVCDATTFADLVKREKECLASATFDYAI